MKKFTLFFAAIAVTLAAVFSGCKSTELPDAKDVNAYAKAFGFSTAIVVKLAKADTNVVNGVCQVLEEIRTYIPEENQTFEELWPPKAAAIVDQLVAAGKIAPEYKDPINKAFVYVCKGLDLAKKKHPIWFKYEELAKAALDGFIEGFYTVMKYNGVSQNQADAAELSANENQVKELCSKCGVPYLPLSARRK